MDKKMIQKSFILHIYFAVLMMAHTTISAADLPNELWLEIIHFTDYDPTTIYFMQQVNKNMRAGVKHFLSNTITPMIKTKLILSQYPSTNHCSIEIKNPFIKHLCLVDQLLEIEKFWDSDKQVKYISFPNDIVRKLSIKNNIRILDYFMTYLSKSTRISELDLANLCECSKYRQFIVFLFYTQYHNLKQKPHLLF
jgi:hypothetical protein